MAISLENCKNLPNKIINLLKVSLSKSKRFLTLDLAFPYQQLKEEMLNN